MSRIGPELIVVKPKYSCRGCVHLKSEYYCVEDGNSVDSGYDYDCMAVDGGKSIPYNAPGQTPDWCPFLPQTAPGTEAKS